MKRLGSKKKYKSSVRAAEVRRGEDSGVGGGWRQTINTVLPHIITVAATLRKVEKGVVTGVTVLSLTLRKRRRG